MTSPFLTPQSATLRMQSRIDPLEESWNLIFEIGKPIVEAIKKINDKYNKEQLSLHISNHRFWHTVPDCIFCTYECEVVEPRERNRNRNPLPHAYDEIDTSSKSFIPVISSRRDSTYGTSNSDPSCFTTSAAYAASTFGTYAVKKQPDLDSNVEYENESSA